MYLIKFFTVFGQNFSLVATTTSSPAGLKNFVSVIIMYNYRAVKQKAYNFVKKKTKKTAKTVFIRYCNAETKRLILAKPSSMSSSLKAYESRKQSSAPKETPGTVATFSASNKISANATEPSITLP